MAYPLQNFHKAMRVLLGDRGSVAAGFDWADEQLTDGIAAVVNMGLVPCVEMEGDEALAAAPPNRSTWGFMVAKAVFLLVGGDTPQSVRTRALSVTVDPAARRDTLTAIETLLAEYEAEGLVCGTPGDTQYKGLMEVVADTPTFFRLARGCHDPAPYPCP